MGYEKQPAVGELQHDRPYAPDRCSFEDHQDNPQVARPGLVLGNCRRAKVVYLYLQVVS